MNLDDGKYAGEVNEGVVEFTGDCSGFVLLILFTRSIPENLLSIEVSLLPASLLKFSPTSKSAELVLLLLKKDIIYFKIILENK